VTATFNSKNMGGDFTKRITVTSNDAKKAKLTLTCKGKCLVPFKGTPRHANFRSIEDDVTPLPMTVQITRGDGDPLQLEIVRTGKPGIEAYLSEIEPGEKYELVIAIRPPLTPGKLRSWVKLKTGVKEVPETTIPVYANIPPGWAKSEFASADIR